MRSTHLDEGAQSDEGRGLAHTVCTQEEEQEPWRKEQKVHLYGHCQAIYHAPLRHGQVRRPVRTADPGACTELTQPQRRWTKRSMAMKNTSMATQSLNMRSM